MKRVWTIIEYWTNKEGIEEVFYLNHAYLSSMSFGSEEMAFMTNDVREAIDYLKKCNEMFPERIFEIMEM